MDKSYRTWTPERRQVVAAAALAARARDSTSKRVGDQLTHFATRIGSHWKRVVHTDIRH